MVHLLPDVVIDIPVVDFYNFVWREMPQEQLSQIAYIDGADEKRSLTYGQVRADAEGLSNALRNPASPWGGIKKGDIITLYGPNSMELPAIIFGVYRSGAGISPSNPNYVARELEHQLKTSGSRLLITHPSVVSTALEAAKHAGIPRSHVLVFGEGATEGLQTISGLIEAGKKLKFGEVQWTADEVKNQTVLVPYSSGTTGLPKGVMLTHYNLVSNVSQWMAIQDNSKPPSTRVCLIPLFHMNGIMQFLCVAPKVGATTVVFPRFDLPLALAAWSKYKVDSIGIVPPIANVIAKHPVVDKFDMSNLKTIGCGAAPLGGEVEDMLTKRFNVIVQQGYGCTEGTCAATLYRHDTPYHRGSVGTPLPNMEVKVVDPDTGKVVGFNKEGELWFKGPNICKGYINNPEATKSSFTPDGFYKTGDIVTINEDRIVWVKDRLKELIKYNAFQVAPAELEDILNSHPHVEDAAVTAAPSEEHGEVPKAYVVLKPGVEKTSKVAKEIKEFLDKSVAPHKRLRGGLEFREVIPKNPSGKILRRVLRDEERERAKAKL